MDNTTIKGFIPFAAFTVGFNAMVFSLGAILLPSLPIVTMLLSTGIAVTCLFAVIFGARDLGGLIAQVFVTSLTLVSIAFGASARFEAPGWGVIGLILLIFVAGVDAVLLSNVRVAQMFLTMKSAEQNGKPRLEQSIDTVHPALIFMMGTAVLFLTWIPQQTSRTSPHLTSLAGIVAVLLAFRLNRALTEKVDVRGGG